MGLSYRQIVMHAISRDVQSSAQPCIYLQLDEGEAMEGGDEDEDEEVLVPDVRLVPSDAQQIDAIFKALCDCAALNPDSDIDGGRPVCIACVALPQAGLDCGPGAAAAGGAGWWSFSVLPGEGSRRRLWQAARAARPWT
jgi:hypothetical protein